jgi:serine/threonine protein kinase
VNNRGYSLATQATLPTGEALALLASGALVAGRYRLVRVLGRGGMGEVWEAEHHALGRAVALKLVQVESGELRTRLLHEARLLAQLSHPAIVAVHDAGETPEGLAYLAMDLLRGETLGQRIQRTGRLPVRETVGIFVELLAGLEVAHQAGIVHRDIKPDNVLLAESGAAAGVAKLIDFGIAVPTRDRTFPEDAAGTPQYMAPEQLRGVAADPRSDIWSACVTLYEALTGRAPFLGQDLVDIARTVSGAPLSYPRDVPELDGALWAILTKGMRKRPEERFATAQALASALRDWHSPPSSRVSQVTPVPSRSAPNSLPVEAPPSSAFDALIRTKLNEV